MEKIDSQKLSIVIMAHPDRREMAMLLSFELGGAPIVWDRKNNVWDTCRRSWEAIDKTAEYGLVIQDDAIVCQDFRSRAEALLTGDYIYNFFILSGSGPLVDKRLSEGKTNFFKVSIYGEVALCMKIKHINSMINYCERKGAKTDTVISSWAIHNHIRVCYPIPSLVDHREGESIFQRNQGLAQREKPHHSYCFADNFNSN